MVRDEVMHTTADDQDARRNRPCWPNAAPSPAVLSTSAGQWDGCDSAVRPRADVALLDSRRELEVADLGL